MNISFLIILLILYKSSYLSFNASNILNNPYNYRYKLCSGNGEPTYNSETNKVSCKCKERYTNEPEKKLEKYLNGNLIQCSYEKKSRFTTLFLALCIPFGFDFLYLGRWRIFTVVFCLIFLEICLNFVMFYINYQINIKNKENKINYKHNKMKKSSKNDKNENKILKLINVLNIIAKISLIIHLLYCIVVVCLHAFGKIPDYHGVDTQNDLSYLFQISSNEE